MAAVGLGRRRGLPVPGPARPPAGARRHQPAARARGARGRRAARARLTPLGRRLAQLPVDPRFGRMVLEADRLGCADEVIVIAAALSIQDPRERPAEERAAGRPAARALHRTSTSDFLALPEPVALPARAAARAVGATSSASAARRSSCTTCASASGRTSSASCARRRRTSAYDQPDAGRAATRSTSRCWPGCSRTSGCATRSGASTRARAARASRSSPAPRSPGSQPAWVMVAELVETSRLWGRTAARIEPRGSSRSPGTCSAHLRRAALGSAGAASVVATERVTLYGLPIVAGRTVAYGRIDPAVSRELFIRRALVEGEWEARHAFLARERARAWRRSRRWRTARAGATCSCRRPGALRLLRRADPGRRRVRRALRPLVARRARAATRTC